jgi:hypothetical protein
MTLYSHVRLAIMALLIVSACLFIVKIILAEHFRKKHTLYLEPKLGWWYSSEDVKSPHLIKWKPLMQWSNILTTAMWLMLITAVGLAWLVR